MKTKKETTAKMKKKHIPEPTQKMKTKTKMKTNTQKK
jgi:hypothetical protein